MRRVILPTLFILIATLLLVVPARADRSDEWAIRRDAAMAAFETARGVEGAHAIANMTYASASRWGWEDQRTQDYLDELYALRNPDGGWGLPFAYDAFGDGTVNPVNTTYTITIAYQVGPVLLEGWRAGVVPASDIQTIIDLLLSTSNHADSEGRCYAYSRSPHDAVTASEPRCVHNVNASVGSFLQQAMQAGFTAPDIDWRIIEITRKEWAHYHNGQIRWHYYDLPNSPWNGLDHNSVNGEAMLHLIPSLGYRVARYQLSIPGGERPTDPIAHFRLTGAPDPLHPEGQSAFCEWGDQWLAEFDAFVANPPPGYTPGERLSQAAVYAARNAEVC